MSTRDIVIETRVNSIDLASCMDYLCTKGVLPRNNSDAICLCVQLAAHAVKGKSREFATITEARTFLEQLGLSLNRKGTSNALRLMQEDALLADGFSPDYGKHKTTVDEVDEDNWKKMVEEAINKVDGET
jgi:hypothetical protein